MLARMRRWRKRRIEGWQRHRRVKFENKRNGKKGKKIDPYRSRKPPLRPRSLLPQLTRELVGRMIV
jgi:hypothetical protein